MGVEESKIAEDVFEGLAENTRINYRTCLRQFLRFVNRTRRKRLHSLPKNQVGF